MFVCISKVKTPRCFKNGFNPNSKKKNIAFMACDIFNLWIKIRQWNPLKNHNILLAFFATK